jgi:tetratricopeptide (TPR) repeat protein
MSNLRGETLSTTSAGPFGHCGHGSSTARVVGAANGPVASAREFALRTLSLILCFVGVSYLGATASPAGTFAPVIRRAEDLAEWGRWKEARATLARAVAEDKQDTADLAPLLAFYAHVVTAFGDYSSALGIAKRAVSLDGNCAYCHLFLSEAMGERAKHLSKFHALVELRSIRKELDRAAQLAPGLDDVQWGMINYNLQVPPAAGGRISDALQHANILGRIDPIDGHIARATIFLAMGRNNQVLDEYRQAVREAPDNPRSNFSLGMALFQIGRYAEALPYLAKAHRLQNQSPLYAAYYAASLVHLNRQLEAKQVLDTSLPAYPDSRLPDYLVAKALREVGQNFVWARELLRSYLQTPPEPDQPTSEDAQQLLASLG